MEYSIPAVFLLYDYPETELYRLSCRNPTDKKRRLAQVLPCLFLYTQSMKRFTQDNPEHIYDIVIVGGGIYGAAMAYTASLNGLDVLLLEKDDFAAHTSANSQKVIHGGLRYLQSLDLKRVIESIREKQRFYHLFPHQVKPLPCLLPTSGFTMKGNEAFRIAFGLYGLLEKLVCRNKLKKNLDKRPAILTRAEVCHRFSHLENEEVRGGALWYDGICNDPERVILSLLRGASKLGCDCANYMKVTAVERDNDNTLRLQAHDKQTGKTVTTRSRKVALCSGSWYKDNLVAAPLPEELKELHLIRGVNLIVPSLFQSATSFATKVTKGESSRFLFIVPWKNYSIEGTHWEDCTDPSKTWSAKEQVTGEFHTLTQEAIHSLPTNVPVLSKHIGFVPGTHDGEGEASERILPHYKLVELEGEKRGDIVQVVGVKFTTAFDVVLKGLKQLFPERKIEDVLNFDTLPVGSPGQPPAKLFALYRQRNRSLLSYDQCSTLFSLFGTELPDIIQKTMLPQVDVGQAVTEDVFYRGLVRHCVQNEMVVHLEDLIFRRIFPDNPEPLSEELVELLAKEMAMQLHWSDREMKREMEKVHHLQE